MPDSLSAWLRSLAAEATPGDWLVIREDDREAYVWSRGANRDVIARPEPWEDGGVTDADARLIALAPDLAVLLADAIDALEHVEELRLWEPGKAGYAAVQNRALELSGALLARFAALQPERGGGAA